VQAKILQITLRVGLKLVFRMFYMLLHQVISECEPHVNFSDYAACYIGTYCNIISSFSDSGAEVCVIKSSILEGSSVSPIGKVALWVNQSRPRLHINQFESTVS